jgi:LacI family transcriptional regulator
MKTSREVTIYDIARKLSISPSTVSRALKDHANVKKETRKKITTVAKELGYQRNKFASNLRLRKTHTLGVVVPKLDSYFMATAIAGIEKITNKCGYSLIINQSQESGKKEAESVMTLFNSRVDGLLVSLAYDTRNLDHFRILFDKNIPVVFFDRVFECSGCASVVIDNYRAAYETVAHLIDQGCRRIFHLGGSSLRNVYADRMRGYRQALEDNNIRFDKELLIISQLDSASVKENVKDILRMKKKPDAVFTANDSSAVSLMVELRKAGIKVPADIAVAGFNNEPMSQIIQPNLTTVNYPAHEMGEIAATTLIQKLNNVNSVNLSTIILEHKLIVRESTIRKKQ